MLWVIVSTKVLVEVALLALLGQLVLGWLIGPKRVGSGVYRLLQIVASPAHRLADALSPRWVLVQHRPWVALALLALAWAGLTIAKIVHCLDAGVARCLT
jgi:hypothetical protein